ncbi:MAG TPA: PASTA domain-containing protein [Candidatus Aphodomonas merdavium]|nr:PASTA domain-containing protein [Candidatus Aphodomonas merdavium]
MPTPGMIVRKRLIWLAAVITVLFFSVIVRVGRLSIVDAEELVKRGEAQWTRTGAVTAERGSILDANGGILAHNATAYIVAVSPRLVTDGERLCDLLCPLLNLEREDVLTKLKNTAYASVTLKRQVTRDVVDAIRDLADEMPDALRGVTFEQDSVRFYPSGTSLSHVLGLTNIDGEGQSGLERQYDAYLAGTPGRIITEVDAKSRALADGKSEYVPATPGADVVLTVNGAIQAIAERAMRECLAVNNAQRVMALVMEPDTGKILAMAIQPSMDLNDPPRSDLTALQDGMRIQAISDVYEPGSTFKIITAAAALNEGVTTPEEGFYCSGSIIVDGDRIRCWKNSHGAETMREGLMNSCNPVFTELALRLGVERMYQYLSAFGLGTKTGIDLPGESAGLLIARRYVKNVDLARIGFGQSVAVTPVQLLTAACAVINGGRLMQPYLVEDIIAQDGTVLQHTAPKVVSQPISEETSATMRSLLEAVVAEGGGANGAVSGYRVGGKTGTAQVYKDGKVVHDVHIGSFFGFAPVEDPRLAVLVIVDEAQVPVDYGSTTAAPFAAQILSESLQALGIAPTETESAQNVSVPDVAGMALEDAAKALEEAGLRYVTDGDSQRVLRQLPEGGAEMAEGSIVMLYVSDEDAPQAQEFVSVPDVSGMSIAEANRLLFARKLVLSVEGSGLAQSQSPAAGAFVAPGSTVVVQFAAR